MQKAEEFLYDYPDSAMVIMRDLPASLPAVRGNASDKARASFFQGLLRKDNGDYSAALIYFLEAADYAEKTNDDKLKAEIYSSTGETYGLGQNYTDELLYSQKALKYFIDCGFVNGTDRQLMLLANAFHHNNMFEMADKTYSLVDTAGKNALPAILGKAGNALRLEKSRYDEAVVLFDKSIALGATLSNAQWCQYAYALLLSGDKYSSEAALSNLDGSPEDAESLWWLYRISVVKGDKDQALDYIESYNTENRRIAQAVSTQDLYKAQIEYASQLARKAKMNSRAVKVWSAVLVVLVLLVLLIFYLVHKQLVKDKEILSYKLAETNMLLELAKDNESKKLEAEEKALRLQRSFASMFKSQLSSIGKMYKTNLSASLIMDEGARHYAERVTEVLSNISSDKGKSREFESWINKELDGIMLRIRQDFPDFDEKTYRFICYMVVGFKDPTIASIFNESISTVSTRKSRLRKKILSSQTPNADLYKLFLS